MKKKLIFILTLILLLLILINTSLLEKFIEKQLSSFTEHKVKLNISKFNLFSGNIVFDQIKLKNKENFFNQNIFEAEKIIIKLDTKTYFSDLIIINTIIFYKPKFFFEIKNINQKQNKKDNIKILEKLNYETEPKIYPKKVKDKNFLISQLQIDKAIMYIKYDDNINNLSIPLSDMNFGNVGNSGSKEIKFQHYKDVMKLILNDIYFRIPDENLRNLIKNNYNIK